MTSTPRTTQPISNPDNLTPSQLDELRAVCETQALSRTCPCVGEQISTHSWYPNNNASHTGPGCQRNVTGTIMPASDAYNECVLAARCHHYFPNDIVRQYNCNDPSGCMTIPSYMAPSAPSCSDPYDCTPDDLSPFL